MRSSDYNTNFTHADRERLKTVGRTLGNLLDILKDEDLSSEARMAWRACMAALGDLDR